VILSSIGGSVASTSDLKSASTPVVFDTAPATPFGVGAAAAGGAERQDGEWEEVVSVREVDAGAVNQLEDSVTIEDVQSAVAGAVGELAII